LTVYRVIEFFSDLCISFIFPNCRAGFLWIAQEPVTILYLVRQLAEKKRERKRKNLIRLGVNPRDAFRWSRIRLGGWAIAQSPILNTTIAVELLRKRGYESMLSWYQKAAPDKFTPSHFPFE